MAPGSAAALQGQLEARMWAAADAAVLVRGLTKIEIRKFQLNNMIDIYRTLSFRNKCSEQYNSGLMHCEAPSWIICWGSFRFCATRDYTVSQSGSYCRRLPRAVCGPRRHRSRPPRRSAAVPGGSTAARRLRPK